MKKQIVALSFFIPLAEAAEADKTPVPQIQEESDNDLSGENDDAYTESDSDDLFGAEYYTSLENDFINRFPKLYMKNIDGFINTIFSDIRENRTSQGKPEDIRTIPDDIYSKHIYNYNGYSHEDPSDSAASLFLKAGSPLIDTSTPNNDIGNTTKEDIPIGYDIYIPQGEAKAIYVRAYGGGKRENGLYQAEKYLLSQGIVVIILDLVDLIDLKGTYQLNMPEELHSKLHASIDAFYRAIKTPDSPLYQNPELSKLYKLPIFLFGGSFGGRTSLRHAELYPETFDGYISQNGTISFYMFEKADRHPGYFGSRRNENNTNPNSMTHIWLSPITDEPGQPETKITKIKRPVLLIHNRDDNNVNIKTTEQWYKKAQKVLNERKDHPLPDDKFAVRLHVPHEGGPPTAVTKKGHGFPIDPIDFRQQNETLSSFILNGPQSIKEFSDWKAYKTGVLSNKFYIAVEPLDDFISEAYRLYEKRNPYAPSKEGSPNLNIEDQVQRDWKDYYRPLYYACLLPSIYLKSDTIREKIQYLTEQNYFTNENVSKALKNQLPLFIKYLREQNIDVPKKIDIDLFSKNEALINNYMSRMSWNDDVTRSLLKTFFIANPKIVEQIVNDSYPKNNPEEAIAQESLVKTLEENREHAKKTFQSVVKEVLKQSKK